MTAVIYARYSSDSQREASIEGQLRDCKDYAEKNGITVVGTYIDRAYSAKTDDRPDFQRMIKDSGKKIFDVVLVWKLDRFARNRFDAVNYKYQLEKNGVHLVSAMEPISQGPEGIMVESMLIGMAEYYSAELALKVARGERENALQCKYNGGVVPLGFTIGKEDRLYHIDPETAPIVQEIFTRYANGEPAEKIAASLNERGLRTRTGKPFVKNSFFQIFRNRRYIGEYRYKDIVTPGGIPAIVDEDLFDRVQQRFEQNRIAHGRPAKEDVSYLLTTKLFCGKCGTLMGGESGTSHMGNTYYYYKCGNAKRHGKAHCDLKAIRKEPLERFVVDTAIKVIFSDEIIERLIDLVMEAQQQENTRLPVLKEQLRDTEKRLANLLEAIEQGILTPTTKQRLDELEARKEALNTSILEEELKKPILTREWIRFWLEKFRKGDVGSTEHQRQIIDTFVNSVYVFDDRVVLNFNFTDDAKTVTREEVLGSSAVDNAPPRSPDQLVWGFFCGGRYRTRTARPSAAKVTKAPVGLWLVRGSQPVGMSTGMRERSGDFFVVDGTGRHGSTHQLSWAVLPKTPAGTGHPLPGGLYWEQQKNRGTGECGMMQENGMMLEVLPLEAGGARLVRVYGQDPCVVLPGSVPAPAGGSWPITELGDYCFSEKPRSLPASDAVCRYQVDDTGAVRLTWAFGQAVGGSARRYDFDFDAPAADPDDLHPVCGSFVEEVTLPDRLQVIGSCAFYNCRKLRLLTVGAEGLTLGSDVFLNCFALETIRVQAEADAATGLFALVNNITEAVRAEFRPAGAAAPLAALWYPAYWEDIEETPAHILLHTFSGQGYHYRQCFLNNKFLPAEYDAIFPQGHDADDANIMAMLCFDRLRCPWQLSETAAGHYRAFLSANTGRVLARLLKAQDTDSIRALLALDVLDKAAFAEGAALAAKAENAAAAALLADAEHKKFAAAKPKRRYDFDF